MIEEIIIPNIGANIDEGEIIEWLVSEGDEVQLGDPLFSMETTKATFEVEAEREGIILKIIHKNGIYNTLSVVGYIGDPGDTVPA